MSDTTDEVRDCLVVGLGAVGGIWSYLLEKSGKCRVTAVARSAYDAIQRDGVTLKSAKFGHIPGWKPYRVVKDASEAADRRYAFVVCTFKCLPDIQPTASVIAPFIVDFDASGSKKAFPTIVLIQNGIGIEQPVAEAFPSAHIISCVAWIGANLLMPGKDADVSVPTIEHGSLEKLVLGLYEGEGLPPAWSLESGASDGSSVNSFCEGLLDEIGMPMETSARARRKELGQRQAELFASFLRAGGGDAQVAANIQAARWQKNMWNAGWGTLSALNRAPTSACVAREVLPITLPVVRRVMIETLYVARGLHYGEDVLPASTVDQTLELTVQNYQPNQTPPGSSSKSEEAVDDESGGSSGGARITDSFKPSILLDLEKGVPMELEPIIGAVLDRARLLNIETPRLDLAFAALKVQQEAAAHRYAQPESNAAQEKHLHHWSMRKPSVAGAGASGREAWLREVQRRAKLGGQLADSVSKAKGNASLGPTSGDKVRGKPSGGSHV